MSATNGNGTSLMGAGGLSRRAFVAALGAATVAGMGILAGCSGGNGSDGSQGDDSSDASSSNELGLIEEGKLIVGSDCAYPPFTYLDGEQSAGFEYELMCAICDEIGLTCEYHTPLDFDTLCASVAAGGMIDVAVSAITIEPERQETVDFTEPYFDSNQSVTVLKDSGFESAADLAGKRIAVQSGTTGETWAKENIEDAEVTPFDEAPAAMAALQAGKAEAVVIDLPVAVEMLNSSYDSCEIIEEVPTGEQYGIAVSKDNNALRDRLNEGLAAIRENGTYQEIYDSYFAVEG